MSNQEKDFIEEIKNGEEMVEQKEVRIYESKLDWTGSKTNSINIESSFSEFRFAVRNDITFKAIANQEGMWALVTWKWLRPFAEWINGRKVLEVMSGRGWISKGLRELGVDVIATDNFSSHMHWNGKGTVTDVEEIDSLLAVEKYGKNIDILLMAWAPYNDPIAYNVAKKLYEVNPDTIIVFIGESWGGCTANDEFFDSTETIDDPVFEDTVSDNYEAWFSVNDYPMLLKYKDNSQ